MSSEQRRHFFSAGIWIFAITMLHFLITTQSPSLHWLHIVLSGLYIVPVVSAAIAFGWVGGLLSSCAVSVAYLGHLLWSWSDSPMANPDQFGWLGVYPVIGLIAGRLVHTANVRKRQRDEVIARTRHAELINGLAGLLAAVNARDSSTVSHSRRVADVATSLAQHIGYEADAVGCIRLAALAHDIGKAGIPDAVLFKHGPLDTEQRKTMREHVQIAVKMLDQIPGTEQISRLVAQHHECPDGSGYPQGLTQEEIHPLAAVLHVADIFVALTEPRSYHEAMSSEQALDEMASLVGTGLDPRAFEALEHLHRHSPESITEHAQQGEPA